MLRPLLFLVVAFSFLWGGGALADGPAWDNYKTAIRGAVQGSTLDEVIQWSDRQFARRAAVGRYVRWGGTIVLGAALIAAGLDYFYNYLRRETGTSLDRWVNWGGQIPGPVWGDWVSGNRFPDNRYELYNATRPKCGYGVSPYVTVIEEQGSRSGGNYIPNQARAMVHRENVGVLVSDPPIPQFYTFETVQAAKAWAIERATQLWWEYLERYCGMTRPPLPQFIQQNPDAANGVRQVVDTYLRDHPIGSPSAPYPGVRLEPIPNPNQWTDNPFTRPDIDTDGDGWPDSIEWYEANRRGVPWPEVINNPQVYPDPNADPDGDGYTNFEELIAGTNPYDPASRPSSRFNPGTRTDTDGDGWPDDDEIRLGTDPNDPNSKPEGEPPQRREGEDFWSGGPRPVNPDPVELPEVELEKPEVLPELKQERWQEFIESTQERLETRFKQLRDTALNKIPFAFVNLVGWRTNVGSSPCAFPVTIGPYQAQVDICGTPVWEAATAFRPVLVGLLFVGFGFAFVRRSLDVQT